MQSLTTVRIGLNPWLSDKERVQSQIAKVSECWNLEVFDAYPSENADLPLNLAINRAWRRELCYKKASFPSKLFPLVIDRALRKTKPDLRADVVLPLLRERIDDLIPVPNP